MPKPTLFYGDVLCISYSDGRSAKASKTSLSAQDPQMACYDAACLSRINSEHRQIRLRQLSTDASNTQALRRGAGGGCAFSISSGSGVTGIWQQG